MAVRPSWKIALAVAVVHCAAWYWLFGETFFNFDCEGPLCRVMRVLAGILSMPGMLLWKHISLGFWVIVANSLLWGVVIAYLFAFARAKIRR
jgi:hypothetical protein